MENLEEKCMEWDKCRRKNPANEVMNTSVLFTVLGHSFRTLLETAGFSAIIVASLLLAFYFWTRNSAGRDLTKHY